MIYIPTLFKFKINYKKIILMSLGFLFFPFDGISQENKAFLDKYTYFIIKVTDEVTQNYADQLVFEYEKKWTDTDTVSNKEIPFDIPKPPPPAVYKKESIIHFFIKPDYYTQYIVNCKGNREVTQILKVDRNTLIGSTFTPYSFHVSENNYDFNRLKNDDFEIIQIDRNDKRNIGGFDCFKILIETKGPIKWLIEMFVTDQINLNYNPAFSNPHLLEQFYPLYVKKYSEHYPQDIYTEYIFEKV